METPSSTKRVTRSQTLLALTTTNDIPISRKIEDSERNVSKSRTRKSKQQQEDRSALIDITNECSPIVGLAMGCLQTPSSAISKQRSIRANSGSTPGSGEALLRGQVKTLLQRVEEEAEISKVSLENRPFLHLQGFVDSFIGVLAPTPANTPQLPNLSGQGNGTAIANDNGLASFTPLPVVEEQLKICQVVSDIFNGKKQESSVETEKSLTRSLLMDFYEKTETSDSSECSSVEVAKVELSESSKDKSPATDDDNAPIWSIQVNASDHDEVEEEEEEEEDYYEYYDETEDDNDDGWVDELCEGLCKITVNEKTMAKFSGKHTRFVYNEEEELVGQVNWEEK